MPLALRGMSIRLQRWLRRTDAFFLRQVHERFLAYEASLKGLVDEMGDEVAPSGVIDPARVDALQRRWFRKMQTPLLEMYDRIYTASQKHPFESYRGTFEFWRRELRRLYPIKVKEAIDPIEISFTPIEGFGRMPGFQQFVDDRFGVGQRPNVLIKTLSSEHLRELHKQFSQAIEAGKGALQTRDDFVRSLKEQLTDPSIRQKMEHNVLRIVRTEYGQASNWVTSQFAKENSHVVKELERVADGRPCIACIALDGKRYPVGSVLDDHPNGMCTFAPVLYTLEELGYEKEVIPKGYQQAWKAQARPYPTMQQSFYKLPDVEKAKVFQNKAYFELWKRERFPLEKLVVKRDGMPVPVGLRELQANLKAFGAVSAPTAVLSSRSVAWFTKEVGEGQAEKVWLRVDDLDRAEERVLMSPGVASTLFSRPPKAAGGNSVLSFEPDLSAVSPDLKARLQLEKYDVDVPSEKLIPFNFNRWARMLGLWVRKADNGVRYVSVPLQSVRKADR